MKYLQYLVFCFVFVACNKKERVNKDPIYVKMLGKWTECNSNDPTTYEFSKSGKVSISRPVEREIIFYPNTITNVKGHIYINGVKWNYFGFTDGKTKADCGFFINNNWDSIQYSQNPGQLFIKVKVFLGHFFILIKIFIWG